MKEEWKLLKSKEVYYICNSNLFDDLEIIKDNLTRKEALNFWKILNKLRS